MPRPAQLTQGREEVKKMLDAVVTIVTVVAALITIVTFIKRGF